MKLKKRLFATVLSVLSSASILALAGCSNTSSEVGKPGDTSGNTEAKTYQFLGLMDDADLASYGMQYALWLKLDADGTASMDRYGFLSYDDSPAAENSSYTADYMVGTWEETTRDGVECVEVSVGVKTESGEMTAVTTGSAYNIGGKYSFELTVPIVVGMFDRAVTFEGQEGTLYEDADAFIQANVKKFEAPESVTTLTDAEHDATVYIQDDGNALMYYGYSEIATGTYTNDGEGALAFTFGEDEKIDATVDVEADTASFTYHYVMYGDFAMDLKFTGTYSKIPEIASSTEEPDESENSYTGTYNKQTWTLTLNDETNCTMSTTMGGFSVPFNGTYVKDEENIVTITCNPSNPTMQDIWAGVKDVRWKLNDADHTMTPVTEQA